MARSYGEPLKKLRAVPIKDNGEKLVDPIVMSDRIHWAKEHPRIKGTNRESLLRESVAKKLVTAAESLPNGIDIEVFEGYRSLATQRQQYEFVRDLFTSKNPTWSKSVLQRAINSLSAPPDDPCPPPHTTGAAVDLYLMDAKTGRMLDMTSPFEWDETTARTDLPGLSEVAAKNRRLLVDTMESAGLTNYAGEWWHWSYGDSGWALRTGSPFAIYGRILES